MASKVLTTFLFQVALWSQGFVPNQSYMLSLTWTLKELDLISALYSIPLLLCLSRDSQTFYHFDSTVLVSGESRTLPTSSGFLAILGLLLFQTNFTIILSYPHQVHKRLWRTIWNWIEYMNKLRIYIIAIFSSMKIICISLYVYPFEYPLVQIYNSLFSILSPMILFSSVLFRVLKVTSRHQRFCNHIYTLDPRGGLSVNASVQLKCNTLLFSSAASLTHLIPLWSLSCAFPLPGILLLDFRMQLLRGLFTDLQLFLAARFCLPIRAYDYSLLL